MIGIRPALRILLWSYAVVYVLFCSLEITQFDLWWQLPEGLRLWKTFALPTQPLVAFGLPARPYFDEYAGYEMALAALYKIGGFFALWLFFAGTYLAVIFLPLVSGARKFSSFNFSSILALLVAGLLLRDRLGERPDMVGSVLEVTLMILLRRARLDALSWKTLAGIALIFLVWTNTHITFLIGLFTLALWTAGEMVLRHRSVSAGLLRRGGGLLAAVSVLPCLINPYGPARLLFPLGEARDPASTVLSPEMWPLADQSPVWQIEVALAVVLLGWFFLRDRARPAWLVLFSLAALGLSIAHFRFVSLLAIALMFALSFRDEHAAAAPPSTLPHRAALLETFFVALGCVAFFLADSFSFRLLVGQVGRERLFATETAPFAFDLTTPRTPRTPTPVLCGLGEAAYLCFDPDQIYRPLLDTGVSRFSDETKRYFFFVAQEPQAFRFALDHLRVDTVILNHKQSFRWLLALDRRPDWKLAVCADTSQLWQRGAPGSAGLAPALRLRVEEDRDRRLAEGNVFEAFCCSTILGDPASSLALLARDNGSGWIDADLGYLLDWIAAQPSDLIVGFLDHPPARLTPLIQAALATRLGPEALERAFAAHPSLRQSRFGRLLLARNALDLGQLDAARKIVATLPAHPPISSFYYTLVDETDPARLDAYGRWETWDDAARISFVTTTGQLNDRLVLLNLARPEP